MTAPTRVLLVCSGLDHAHRGYESFARECFAQLRREPDIRIELVKGSGPRGPDERAVPTLRRDKPLARALGRIVGFRPFRLEAAAFALSLQPVLARRRPDVVYLSEWDTARGLAALRRLSSQRFRLLLCNGGFAQHGFDHLDHVQELTPAARDHVVGRGADPARHTVLPLGFVIAPELVLLSAADRAAVRTRWGLPADRQIIVSVAALNRSHKRLDYLIDEVAELPEPRPYTLMIGEPDGETPAVRAHAATRLGSANHGFLTVSSQEVPELLRASDMFVLTSLAEMQGRAVVEAMAHGLPCVVHDSAVMRFAVGDQGIVGDLAQSGSLTGLVVKHLRAGLDPAEATKRHRHVYERFSWERLRRSYVRLLTAVSDGTLANTTVSSSAGEKLSM